MTTLRSRPLNLLPKHSRPVWPLQAALGAVVLVTLTMAWSLWGPSGRDSTTAMIAEQLERGTASSATPLPTSGSIPVALSQAPVTGVALGTESDSVRFFEEKNGRAYQVRIRSGSTVAVSETDAPYFATGWWVPGRQEALTKSDDGDTVALRHIDYGSGRSSAVGTRVTAAAISPDGSELAFVEALQGSADIMRSRTDGTDARRVLSVRSLDTHLAWRDSATIAVTLRQGSDNTQDLVLLSEDGSFEPLLTGLRNLETVWSRDGAWLLYSYYDEARGTVLRLLDADDGTEQAVGLRTSAAKCAWAPNGASFVCGVPASDAFTADVPADLTATNDSLVVVDRGTLEQAVRYPSSPRPLLSVSRPLVSSSGSFVVFTNLYDRRLYLFPL